MTEAILHLGVHKTGTSSIQKTLENNRDLLMSQGVLYPDVQAGHFELYTALCDAPLDFILVRTRGITTDEEVDVLRRDILKKFEAQIRQFDAPRLLISSEVLSWMDEGELRRLRAWLEGQGVTRVTIALYLRDHLSYWESMLQQDIRGGRVYDLAAEARDLTVMLRYQPLLETLCAVFGKEALKVRVFAPLALKDGDAVADFAEFVGIDLSGATPQRTNESVSRDAAILLNEIDRRMGAGAMDGGNGLADAFHALRSMPGEKLRAGLETARRIRTASAADRAYVAETWTDGVDHLGSLIDARVSELEGAPGPEVGDVDVEGAFDAAAHLYLSMRRRLLTSESDRLRLKARIVELSGDKERAAQLRERSAKITRELERCYPRAVSPEQ